MNAMTPKILLAADSDLPGFYFSKHGYVSRFVHHQQAVIQIWPWSYRPPEAPPVLVHNEITGYALNQILKI